MEAGSTLVGKGGGAGSMDRSFSQCDLLRDVFRQAMDGLQQRDDAAHAVPDRMVY